MIKICSLSSGSNGNAFFIRTGTGCFLVDAGISCKQITLRLLKVGSGIDEVKGIFVTHEHTDHVRGLQVLLKKHRIPVYVTPKTHAQIAETIPRECVRLIQPNERVSIDETTVQALPKSHDAVEPTLFNFYYRDKKISIITDAGYGCDNVIESIRDADALFLESNYDEKMLASGFYPPPLKRRVASDHGHLSNVTAGSLVREHASPNLEYLFLSHLSENNNTPVLAMETVKDQLKHRRDLNGLNTLLTSRHEVSPLVEIKTGK